MGKLYKFEKKKSKKKSRDSEPSKPRFTMFQAISEAWGADFDKILFEDDDEEAKKLERAVQKENLRFIQKKKDN